MTAVVAHALIVGGALQGSEPVGQCTGIAATATIPHQPATRSAAAHALRQPPRQAHGVLCTASPPVSPTTSASGQSFQGPVAPCRQPCRQPPPWALLCVSGPVDLSLASLPCCCLAAWVSSACLALVSLGILLARLALLASRPLGNFLPFCWPTTGPRQKP